MRRQLKYSRTHTRVNRGLTIITKTATGKDKATTATIDSLPITKIKGVGARLAETLQKLGIASVQDALFHLPMRYLNRTRITPMRELALNSSVVVEGFVKSCSVMFGRRRSLFVTIEDSSGSVNLRFFHFNAAQKNMFAVGNRIRCAGDPRLGSTGLEFYHPEYEVVDENSTARKQKLEEALTPIYSLPTV